MSSSIKIIAKRIDSEFNDASKTPSTVTQDTILDVKSLVNYLEKKYGVISECLVDGSGFPRCMYLQDCYMKDVFNFYPDRMCIDVTYKYLETDVFMYIFTCEDSNGRNHIISLAFLMINDFESLTWLCSVFKKHNPNWRKTNLIIVDPEIRQKDAIRNSFLHPYILICFYHAYKSFKSGVENLINQNPSTMEQKQLALDLFKNMYLAHTHAEYELYYQQFIMLHNSIVSYFQEFWMPLQFQWRTGLDYYHENILSSLNFHLEEIDNSIKSVFSVVNNSFELIKKLFLILSFKRKEKSSLISHCIPTMYSRFSSEHQISKLLTPYASRFVIDQLDMSSEINTEISVIADSYFFDYLGASVYASASVCSCHFFLYTFLPCRHIFAVRRMLSLCMFEEALCDYTWSTKYYQSAFNCMQDSVVNNSNMRIYESGSKLTCVSSVLESMLPVLLEAPQPVFESHYELLNQIICSWKSNENVCLQLIGVENNLTVSNFYSGTFCEKMSPTVSCKAESIIPEKSFPETLAKQSTDDKKTVHEKKSKQSKWNFKCQILSGKHINYTFLCRVICHTKEECILWLRSMKLLPTSMLCPSCGHQMSSKSIYRLSDGAVWVCSNTLEKKSCSRRCSVRKGSWFELTNMTLEQILTFCYMWINGFSQSQIISETGISSATYVAWNKFNRRVCEEVLLEETDSYNKGDPSGYAQILDLWLKKYEGEDTFLKFLQDAAVVHQKDLNKPSIRVKKKITDKITVRKEAVLEQNEQKLLQADCTS